ncbi:putative Chromodomain-helicase-DNA-binding protein [Blattamonas nauphoetae]|uniref:Chromodomain-helicase-DNA-binding protein n=1 Tax=Blattamonas nauphoetae TaxID=2049346 RepID=A0ABQ9YKP7_9EUKA|nr:putative Chromodomain-helicase-DNA-binding protein [Blattamonas nauphoetae]
MHRRRKKKDVSESEDDLDEGYRLEYEASSSDTAKKSKMKQSRSLMNVKHESQEEDSESFLQDSSHAHDEESQEPENKWEKILATRMKGDEGLHLRTPDPGTVFAQRTSQSPSQTTPFQNPLTPYRPFRVASPSPTALTQPSNASVESTVVLRRFPLLPYPTNEQLDADPTNLEYLIKWKDTSYIHCTWISFQDLAVDRHWKMKYRTFQKKMRERIQENYKRTTSGDVDAVEEEFEPFNPEYVEVDRILAEEEEVDPSWIAPEHDDNNPEEMKIDPPMIKQYLVKWKGLQYSDATMEWADDVLAPDKIEEFHIRQKRPPIPLHKRYTYPDPNDPNSTIRNRIKESPEYLNGHRLRDYQVDGLNWMLFNWYQGRNGILADEMGLGKAQPLTAKVLTPDGWKKMGDLVDGDEVLAASTGQATKIIKVFPQGTKDIFKVSFSDGTAAECTAEHLWTIGERGREQEYKTLELQSFKDSLLDEDQRPRFFIPISAPIKQYQCQLLPTAGLSIEERFTELQTLLNKAESFQVSEEADTKGMISINTDSKLIEVIAELVRSLGGLATHPPPVPSSPSATLSFTLPPQFSLDTVFSLHPHLNNYQSLTSSFPLRRYIVSVHQLPAAPAQCILISDPSHHYITDSFIVTHNTAQSVALIHYLRRVIDVTGPFLIIAPLSTIPHWQRELEDWTDINGVVYHGSADSRNLIRQFEWIRMNEKGTKQIGIGFEVLITTFEMVQSDLPCFTAVNWSFMIIDEAHKLKSSNSKTFMQLKQLHVDRMLLLTGTPLQNNMQELFSILNFLEPKDFFSEQDFMERFGDINEHPEKITTLHTLLKPYLLRRLKDDVEESIPIKEETVIEVELTHLQKNYYKAIHEKNFEFLSQGVSKPRNVPNLLNVMMELRKCCNHPFLIKGVEENVMRETNAETPEQQSQNLVACSGKFVLLDKLLPRLHQEGHKVLVFSQMTRVLDLIQRYLKYRMYPFERIDGSVRGHDRQAAIDRFSKEGSNRFIFLLCTRAGGLGINLTAADTVIIFDSDWNPQNDIQAQARCHRIGQTKAVRVYRLVTHNSYEEYMFGQASLKLGLDRAVMSGVRSSAPQMDKETIDLLLKKGAYSALKDEDDGTDTSAVFESSTIDQILDRSRVIKYQQAGEEKNVFNKASFTMKDGTDITEDILKDEYDDPDFWGKLLPQASLRMLQENEFLPRLRARRSTVKHGKTKKSTENEVDEDGIHRPKATRPGGEGDSSDNLQESDSENIQDSMELSEEEGREDEAADPTDRTYRATAVYTKRNTNYGLTADQDNFDIPTDQLELWKHGDVFKIHTALVKYGERFDIIKLKVFPHRTLEQIKRFADGYVWLLETVGRIQEQQQQIKDDHQKLKTSIANVQKKLDAALEEAEQQGQDPEASPVPNLLRSQIAKFEEDIAGLPKPPSIPNWAKLIMMQPVQLDPTIIRAGNVYVQKRALNFVREFDRVSALRRIITGDVTGEREKKRVEERITKEWTVPSEDEERVEKGEEEVFRIDTKSSFVDGENCNKPREVNDTTTHSYVASVDDPLPFIEHIQIRSQNLPVWWTQTHDRALLVGVWRYGLDGFDEIRNDPDYPFLKIVGPASNEPPKQDSNADDLSNKNDSESANKTKVVKKGGRKKRDKTAEITGWPTNLILKLRVRALIQAYIKCEENYHHKLVQSQHSKRFRKSGKDTTEDVLDPYVGAKRRSRDAIGSKTHLLPDSPFAFSFRTMEDPVSLLKLLQTVELMERPPRDTLLNADFRSPGDLDEVTQFDMKLFRRMAFRDKLVFMNYASSTFVPPDIDVEIELRLEKEYEIRQKKYEQENNQTPKEEEKEDPGMLVDEPDLDIPKEEPETEMMKDDPADIAASIVLDPEELLERQTLRVAELAEYWEWFKEDGHFDDKSAEHLCLMYLRVKTECLKMVDQEKELEEQIAREKRLKTERKVKLREEQKQRLIISNQQRRKLTGEAGSDDELSADESTLNRKEAEKEKKEPTPPPNSLPLSLIKRPPLPTPPSNTQSTFLSHALPFNPSAIKQIASPPVRIGKFTIPTLPNLTPSTDITFTHEIKDTKEMLHPLTPKTDSLPVQKKSKSQLEFEAMWDFITSQRAAKFAENRMVMLLVKHDIEPHLPQPLGFSLEYPELKTPLERQLNTTSFPVLTSKSRFPLWWPADLLDESLFIGIQKHALLWHRTFRDKHLPFRRFFPPEVNELLTLIEPDHIEDESVDSGNEDNIFQTPVPVRKGSDPNFPPGRITTVPLPPSSLQESELRRLLEEKNKVPERLFMGRRINPAKRKPEPKDLTPRVKKANKSKLASIDDITGLPRTHFLHSRLLNFSTMFKCQGVLDRIEADQALLEELKMHVELSGPPVTPSEQPDSHITPSEMSSQEQLPRFERAKYVVNADNGIFRASSDPNGTAQSGTSPEFVGGWRRGRFHDPVNTFDWIEELEYLRKNERIRLRAEQSEKKEQQLIQTFLMTDLVPFKQRTVKPTIKLIPHPNSQLNPQDNESPQPFGDDSTHELTSLLETPKPKPQAAPKSKTNPKTQKSGKQSKAHPRPSLTPPAQEDPIIPDVVYPKVEIEPYRLITVPFSRNSDGTTHAPQPIAKTLGLTLPIEVESVVIHCFGELVPFSPGWATKTSLYPLGFIVSRSFFAMKIDESQNQPNVEDYFLEIALDPKEDQSVLQCPPPYPIQHPPRFMCYRANCRDEALSGSTPDEAFGKMMEAINRSWGREQESVRSLDQSYQSPEIIPVVHSSQHSTDLDAVSTPVLFPDRCENLDFFGLTSPSVRHLIQTLPFSTMFTGLYQTIDAISEAITPSLDPLYSSEFLVSSTNQKEGYSSVVVPVDVRIPSPQLPIQKMKRSSPTPNDESTKSRSLTFRLPRQPAKPLYSTDPFTIRSAHLDKMMPIGDDELADSQNLASSPTDTAFLQANETLNERRRKQLERILRAKNGLDTEISENDEEYDEVAGDNQIGSSDSFDFSDYHEPNTSKSSWKYSTDPQKGAKRKLPKGKKKKRGRKRLRKNLSDCDTDLSVGEDERQEWLEDSRKTKLEILTSRNPKLHANPVISFPQFPALGFHTPILQTNLSGQPPFVLQMGHFPPHVSNPLQPPISPIPPRQGTNSIANSTIASSLKATYLPFGSINIPPSLRAQTTPGQFPAVPLQQISPALPQSNPPLKITQPPPQLSQSPNQSPDQPPTQPQN